MTVSFLPHTVIYSCRFETKQQAMTSLSNLLRFFEIFGSILGLHRNYCSQKRVAQCLIILHVFISIVFHIFVSAMDIQLALKENGYSISNLIYCAFAASAQLTCLPNLVYAVFNSPDFKSYLQSMNRVSKYFENNKKINKAMKMARLLFLIASIFSIVLSVSRTLVTATESTGRDVYSTIVIFASQSILRFTLIYQYLTFFLTVFFIVSLSKCFYSWMRDIDDCLRNKGSSLVEPCIVTKELIEKWVDIYQDLANSCVKLAMCFGRLVIVCKALYYI